MDELFAFQDTISSEFESSTSLVISLVVVITLMAKKAIKSLGRFYRMKLGIKD